VCNTHEIYPYHGTIINFYRVEKKRDISKAQGKQEMGVVAEHYKTVIKNLQSDREKLQRERDSAILRYQNRRKESLVLKLSLGYH
jgi:hypothetical protein